MSETATRIEILEKLNSASYFKMNDAIIKNLTALVNRRREVAREISHLHYDERTEQHKVLTLQYNMLNEDIIKLLAIQK